MPAHPTHHPFPSFIPRSFNGRSKSAWPGSAHDDFAWRTIQRFTGRRHRCRMCRAQSIIGPSSRRRREGCDMGLRGDAAVVGFAEHPHERKYTRAAQVHDRAMGRTRAACARRRGPQRARHQRHRLLATSASPACSRRRRSSSTSGTRSTSRNASISVARRRSAWSGARRPRSSSASATSSSCAAPARPIRATRCRAPSIRGVTSAPAASNGARRRPSSTFLTATSRRTAVTR